MFWNLHGTNVYTALSWDRLHVYHGGLFSDHLLVELREILENMPLARKNSTQIDEA